jgi:hypothetical protein
MLVLDCWWSLQIIVFEGPRIRWPEGLVGSIPDRGIEICGSCLTPSHVDKGSRAVDSAASSRRSGRVARWVTFTTSIIMT